MSFSLASDSSVLKVVVSKDSAVKCSPEEYQSYLEDLDESKLKLEGEPTRFVMSKTLNFKAHQELLRAQAKFGVKGKVEPDLSYILVEVRLSLKDVENPKDLPLNKQIIYKRDSDGFCSEDLVAGLQSHGVLMDLQIALSNSKSKKEDLALTKKN